VLVNEEYNNIVNEKRFFNFFIASTYYRHDLVPCKWGLHFQSPWLAELPYRAVSCWQHSFLVLYFYIIVRWFVGE